MGNESRIEVPVYDGWDLQHKFVADGGSVRAVVKIHMYNPDEPETLCTLHEANARMAEAEAYFTRLAGPLTAGQWALRKGQPVFCIARLYSVFRDPTLAEVEEDLELFGWKIIGNRIPGNPGNRPVIRLGLEKYEYTGPRRLVRVIYEMLMELSIGFPNSIFIERLADMLTATSAPREEAEREEGWHMLFASPEGMYRYRGKELTARGAFEKIGSMSFRRGKLIFDGPEGETDCTELLWR